MILLSPFLYVYIHLDQGEIPESREADLYRINWIGNILEKVL